MLKKGNKVYLIRKNIKIKQPSNKLDYKRLRLFELAKVKRLVNYKLKLLKIIEIYPVFYILLLKLVLPGTLLALFIKV